MNLIKSEFYFSTRTPSHCSSLKPSQREAQSSEKGTCHPTHPKVPTLRYLLVGKIPFLQPAVKGLKSKNHPSQPLFQINLYRTCSRSVAECPRSFGNEPGESRKGNHRRLFIRFRPPHSLRRTSKKKRRFKDSIFLWLPSASSPRQVTVSPTQNQYPPKHSRCFLPAQSISGNPRLKTIWRI